MIPSVTHEYLTHLEELFAYCVKFGKWRHQEKYEERTVPDYVDLECVELSRTRERLRTEIFFLRNELND